MSMDITFAELDAQAVELLPERAALGGWGSKWANVYASNSALALNAGSFHSLAHAAAGQYILVSQ
ncbi:MAG: hypothetical protein U0Q19_15620 [Kineosporiaceae bacterium]